MKGLYYKLPLDFQGLMKRKDIDKISIEDSIRQHIFLISTTSFGECKFDESFGSEIWEMDFDLLKSNNNLREMMMNSLKRDISRNEKRVVLEDISVEISDYNLGTMGKTRMKKRVQLTLKMLIKETNRPLFFQNSFFVGPISY
jgi:GPW/gp25 family protein